MGCRLVDMLISWHADYNSIMSAPDIRLCWLVRVKIAMLIRSAVETHTSVVMANIMGGDY